MGGQKTIEHGRHKIVYIYIYILSPKYGEYGVTQWTLLPNVLAHTRIIVFTLLVFILNFVYFSLASPKSPEHVFLTLASASVQLDDDSPSFLVILRLPIKTPFLFFISDKWNILWAKQIHWQYQSSRTCASLLVPCTWLSHNFQPPSHMLLIAREIIAISSIPQP